ncbi:MAG: hypothetical protein JWN74_1194 [Acidobacteriaceae bacterium]|nr:hypothetical protein [Acidobacteriaceae bacterium]
MSEQDVRVFWGFQVGFEPMFEQTWRSSDRDRSIFPGIVGMRSLPFHE